MRAERPPSPAQRWDYRWAAVQENRFGGGREPSGRRVGTQAANLSQLAWASWPAGGQGQGSARGTDLARVRGALCPSPFPTPTKLGAPSMQLPHSSPRNTIHSPSQASGTLIDPVLPPGFSALTSLAALAPLLAPTPRLSPICPGVRPAHLPALVPLPPHCLPRFAPAWLQAQPHSSPLTLPAHPRPPARSWRAPSQLQPSAGQD